MDSIIADTVLVGLSLDFESTGLNVCDDEITEFGGVFLVFDKSHNVHQLNRNFQMRVRVKRQISVAAQRMTKITNDQLANEQPFSVVLDKFTEFVEQACAPFGRTVDRCLITQNGNAYDVPLLINEMHKNGLVPATYLRRWRITNLVDMLLFCRNPTLLDSTKLMRTKEGKAIYKLGDIYNMVVGKELIGAHGALQDALGVCEILQHSQTLRNAVMEDINTKTPKYVINFDQFIVARMTLIKETSKKKKPETSTERTIDSFFKRRKNDQLRETTTDASSSSSSCPSLLSSSCSSSSSSCPSLLSSSCSSSSSSCPSLLSSSCSSSSSSCPSLLSSSCSSSSCPSLLSLSCSSSSSSCPSLLSLSCSSSSCPSLFSSSCSSSSIAAQLENMCSSSDVSSSPLSPSSSSPLSPSSSSPLSPSSSSPLSPSSSSSSQ